MGFWIYLLISNLMIPAIMIIIGYLFVKRPPKTINSIYGYRTTMSRKNQETWDFAHNYCGKIWLKAGWCLLAVSVLIMLPLIGKSKETIGWVAGIFEFFQCIILIGSIFPTERALKKNFDKNGNRRQQ